ncbi:MAG: NosD domain-containing protein [Thermoleophilia bacterium]
MKVPGTKTLQNLTSAKHNRYLSQLAPGLFLALVLFLLAAPSAMAAPLYVLQDDATGGDCTLIGNWDDASNTCTLTTDIAVVTPGDTGIEIVDSNINLDGAGHQITGLGATFPPPHPNPWIAEYAVELVLVDNVQVRNLLIHDIDAGIQLDGANDNLIIDNEIRDCSHGVWLVLSTGNGIANNDFSNNIWASVDIVSADTNQVLGNTIASSPNWGVRLFESDDNLVSGNLISNTGTPAMGTGTGVWIFYSHNNDIQMNTLASFTYGVLTTVGTGNTIIVNSFIGNTSQAEDEGFNIFDIAAPTGGNRWDDFDEPAEGCNDVMPLDGFCDSPYFFTGNQDNLPRLVCAECPGDLVPVPLAIAIALPLDGRINSRSHGLLSVTINGAADFAVADIDPASVMFAGAAPHRWPRARDVDRDGFDDLVVMFRISDMAIAPGDTEACLVGELLDGTPFEGCSTISVR